ncbi:hypothetical protein [Methylobacterium sp. yr668]|uniref:hypothetical protein n=1 Tax=Methylobacterium sp. yr668 TaxID=1761801 RepID=UPI0008EFF87A|nr:hypothetical protein [Methylobacterium sp. yr668]SFT11545.1 hypothetical protein SAMN04487845_1172 [Methylobacterium sp. yr668]
MRSIDIGARAFVVLAISNGSTYANELSLLNETIRAAGPGAGISNVIAGLGVASSFPPDGTPALLGSGWDSVGSTVMGDCVDRSGKTETILPPGTNAEGQSVVFDAAYIDSVSKMRSVLNVSASASFSYGIYSGGGRYQLFQDDTINSFSSYMYVSVTVLNQTQILSQKNLNAGRVKQISSNKDDFRKACGDQFVSALSTGGTFSAVVRIESMTEAHQKAVSAAINGAIAGFGKASGSVDSQFSSLQSMGKVTIKVIRKGATGDVPELKDFNKYAVSFPAKVSSTMGKPWPFNAIVSSYDTVDNLPTNTSPYTYDQQNIYLEGLASLRDVALQIRNDLLYAYANPDQFGIDDRSDIQKNLDNVNSHISAVLRAANSCKVDPVSKCTEAYPELKKIDAPKRKYSPASEKIRQARELYELRGDPLKLDAALMILSTIDDGTATQDERYDAALLTSEALDWKAARSGFAPITYKDEILPTYKDALAKAVGLAAAMPNKPCEADYLKTTLDFLTGSTNYTLGTAENVMASLSGRSTRTGTTCQKYVWSGTNRWRAWIRIREANTNTTPPAEKARLLSEAAPFAEAAYNDEPDYFPNVYVLMLVNYDDQTKFCKIFNDFLQRSTPARFSGLEPLYTSFKNSLKKNDNGPIKPFGNCTAGLYN